MVPATEARNWRIEGQKRRIREKEYQRLLNKFEMEGFGAQEGLWHFAKENVLRRKEERCQRRRVTQSENTRLCMKKISRVAGYEMMEERKEKIVKVNKENEEERGEQEEKRRRERRERNGDCEKKM